MQQNHYNKIIRTIFITGSAFALNYLIGFFLVPYITKNVGTEAYGFVSLGKNIAAYASYATVIINSYAARFISVEYHQNNIQKANIYFSSAFFGDLILGSVLFLIGICFIFFSEKIINIPEEICNDVKILFLFIFLRFFISTIMSVYNSGAYAADKLDAAGIFKGISYLIEAVVMFTLFKMFPPKVYFTGAGLLSAATVIAASDYWITKKYTPYLKVYKAGLRYEAVSDLISNGIWSAVSSLGNVLNSGLDLLVCNLMLSPFAMGQLAITDTVNAIYLSLYTMIAESFKPGCLKIYSSGNKDLLIKELKTAMKFTGLAVSLFFAGFLVLGRTYYRLWIPEQDTVLIHTLTMAALASGFLIGLEFPLFYIYTLTLTRRISCMFTLSAGVLNVIGMYVLIKYFHMGLYAVVGTTVVLQSFIHLLPHPLYMAHVLGVPRHTFYPDIIKGIISCVVLCVLFNAMHMIYSPGSWISLFVCIVIYSAVGSFIYLEIMLSEEQKKSLKRRLRK